MLSTLPQGRSNDDEQLRIRVPQAAAEAEESSCGVADVTMDGHCVRLWNHPKGLSSSRQLGPLAKSHKLTPSLEPFVLTVSRSLSRREVEMRWSVRRSC